MKRTKAEVGSGDAEGGEGRRGRGGEDYAYSNGYDVRGTENAFK